ncbi:MAG: GntR family transcriptional regulator [Burkholderiales bacterium]|nr:GntR family transcriptional regulator [Burkholderiales bacterium]
MTLHAPGVASAAAGNEFDGHAPVYRQIALILRERMGTRWRAGDELPSEGDLASEFGVNRNTLRRAIGVLVEEGVLERRRGVRLRVARLPGLDHPKLEADPTQLFRMRPGTKFKVLRFEAQPLGPEAAPLLDLPVGASAYRIDRLLLAGKEVLAYLVVFVPTDIGDRLRRLDLSTATITSILYARLRVHTRSIRQSIEATLADTTVAAALGMAPGAAALRCRYVITDDHDRPVQAATYYYRGDRFRLTLEIRTTAPGEASDGQRIADWPLAVTSDAAATSSRGRAVAPRRPRGRKR